MDILLRRREMSAYDYCITVEGAEHFISVEFDCSPFIKGGSEYPGGPPIEPDEPEDITITGVELIVPGPDPKCPHVDAKSIPLPMELFSDAWKASMGIEIMESGDE